MQLEWHAVSVATGSVRLCVCSSGTEMSGSSTTTAALQARELVQSTTQVSHAVSDKGLMSVGVSHLPLCLNGDCANMVVRRCSWPKAPFETYCMTYEQTFRPLCVLPKGLASGCLAKLANGIRAYLP